MITLSAKIEIYDDNIDISIDVEFVASRIKRDTRCNSKLFCFGTQKLHAQVSRLFKLNRVRLGIFNLGRNVVYK